MSEATNQKVPGTQGPFAPKGQNPTKAHTKYVTREEMVAFTAQAMNTAANFILDKKALNDEETFAELKQEI